MKISTTDHRDGYSIQSYAPGQVVINGVAYGHSLVVLPERVFPTWGPGSGSVPDLAVDHFEALAQMDREIVLLGTGRRQHFPSPNLYRCLIEQGVGLEIMDTAAACRTYNILVAESRRVAAALLMIEA